MDINLINTQLIQSLGYNPQLELINAGKHTASTAITITCHGYGANKAIGHYVASQLNIPILTFNFPDHDIDESFNINTSSFGTIREFLPILLILKACINHGFTAINLYGFSAGGGAVINSLALLNNPSSLKTLEQAGIIQTEVAAIKTVLSSGLIILDAPLKSVSEILSIRPQDKSIQQLAKRYQADGFEPIDVIHHLKGLALTIFLYFEQPDEVLSNRDDMLFYERLALANAGSVHLIFGHTEGHAGLHEPLWAALKKRLAKRV